MSADKFTLCMQLSIYKTDGYKSNVPRRKKFKFIFIRQSLTRSVWVRGGGVNLFTVNKRLSTFN